MKEFVRVVKFVLISASAGIIQMVAFTLMNEIAKWDYWLSYLIALVLSVLWNFTINRKATFRTDANYGIAMLKVLGYYCIFTPLSVWGGDALEGIGWNEYLVLILSMVLNMVTEFLFMRYVVYRNKVDNAIAGQNGKADSAAETQNALPQAGEGDSPADAPLPPKDDADRSA